MKNKTYLAVQTWWNRFIIYEQFSLNLTILADKFDRIEEDENTLDDISGDEVSVYVCSHSRALRHFLHTFRAFLPETNFWRIFKLWDFLHFSRLNVCKQSCQEIAQLSTQMKNFWIILKLKCWQFIKWF